MAIDYSSAEFWVALGKIMWINILLSGDNAVVIALACRSLPPHQMRMGIILGSAAAVLLRIIFTFFVVMLMQVPYLQLVGSALLLWIAVKLLTDEGGEHDVAAGSNLWSAVRTIAIADAVMSLDNVIAIAAAAGGNITLIVIGIAVSVPIIVFGSAAVLWLMKSFPMLVTLGAALLGFIAGEIALEDPAIHSWSEANAPHIDLGFMSLPVIPVVCAIFVVVLGKFLHARMRGAKSLDELAADPPPPGHY